MGGGSPAAGLKSVARSGWLLLHTHQHRAGTQPTDGTTGVPNDWPGSRGVLHMRKRTHELRGLWIASFNRPSDANASARVRVACARASVSPALAGWLRLRWELVTPASADRSTRQLRELAGGGLHAPRPPIEASWRVRAAIPLARVSGERRPVLPLADGFATPARAGGRSRGADHTTVSRHLAAVRSRSVRLPPHPLGTHRAASPSGSQPTSSRPLAS